MNHRRGMCAPAKLLYRLAIYGRRLLPRQRCPAFGPADAAKTIECIYVINLDREPDRWREMEHELDRVVDSSGVPLAARTVRFSAVDARNFTLSPFPDGEIDPFYTLSDQLFVEPQPRVVPDRFESV